MPDMVKDKNSGAIIFKKTPQEKLQDSMGEALEQIMLTNTLLLESMEKLNSNMEKLLRTLCK